MLSRFLASRIIFYIFLVFSITQCSSLPKRESPDWLRLNRGKFVKLLKEHRTQEAAPYEVIFSESLEDEPLLAQLHLFLCEPVIAEKHIEKINDLDTRNLFQAVLLSLVSEETPTPNVKTGENTNKNTNKNTSAAESTDPYSFTTPIQTRDEIWSDEWKDIKFNRSNPCSMPTLKAAPLRFAARMQAKTLFEKLNISDFYKDFIVVALASETNANVANRDQILSFYENEKSNVDYLRFADPDFNRDQKLNSPLRVASQDLKRLEISLSELDLNFSETRVHPIPLLVGEGSKK